MRITVSKKKSHHYLIINLGIIVIFLFLTVASGWLSEKLDGDLTRLGYFDESEFGWESAQYKYKQRLFGIGKIGKKYDVVVLGDSFSQDSLIGWVNVVAEYTSLNIGVFHIKNIDVNQFITSYEDHPPRVLIYETVERELLNRLQGNYQCEDQIIPGFNKAAYSGEKKEVSLIRYFRDKRLKKFNIDLNYEIKKFVKQHIYKIKTPVRRYRLNRSDLFSNKRPGEILILAEDHIKRQWSSEDLESIKCASIQLQNKIQKNGYTVFVLMIIPDKSTLYGSYGKDENFSTSKLSLLKDVKGLNYLDLVKPLSHSVIAGEKDIYLPNNTHFSARAYRQIGLETLKFLHTLGFSNTKT
jgi:ribosomal protein S8